MTESEIAYYKKLYGDSYEYMLSVKKSLKKKGIIIFLKEIGGC